MNKIKKIFFVFIMLFFIFSLSGCDLSGFKVNFGSLTGSGGKGNEDVNIEDKNTNEELGDYIDTKIISFSFDSSKRYNVDNMEEMQLVFDAAVLNRAELVQVYMNFEGSLEEIIDALPKNSSMNSSYGIEATSTGGDVDIRFNYTTSPLYKASEEDAYVQYSSLNYVAYVSERTEDFDDFKINSSKLSYNLKTSDQLFYCLERGVKPICEDGSNASIIYNAMKDIFREIIDDRMTNVQKIKAIHDYLILNITYDAALANKMYENNPDINSYRGFYLEGAILDHRAVCEGISKAFTCMCNIEGIPCVQVSGYRTNNPGGPGHAWNKVYLDGDWYHIDPTGDGTVISNVYEILSYQFFLISDETMLLTNTARNFTDLKCEKNYDFYHAFKYEEEKDYSADSFKELKDLIELFTSSSIEKRTIQFDITYTTSYESEIRKAYRELHISSGYTYINNGSVYTLVSK